MPNKNVTVKINTVDHNTFQENITTYLQNPDDVITWFAGYRMRYFAAQGSARRHRRCLGCGPERHHVGAGFKVASTGDDGKLYFVPTTYYCWGIHYRKSLFEENSWTLPTTMDELKALATDMQDKGIIPFAFANDGRWPAMGTFDQLNFRMNGYQFHVDLMAGKENWTDDKVKNVFAKWTELLPFHQADANGRTWQEAAQAVVDKTGRHDDHRQLHRPAVPGGRPAGPRLLPLAGDESRVRHRHDRSADRRLDDGQASPRTRRAPRSCSTTSARPRRRRPTSPRTRAWSSPDERCRHSRSTPRCRRRCFEAVSAAPNVTQFLDRDTSPEFASNVAGPAFADFMADPSKIDSILDDMQAQAEAIYGE